MVTLCHEKFSEGCCIYQYELYFLCPQRSKAFSTVFILKFVIILFSASFLADPFDPFTMSSGSENQALSGPDLFGEFLNPSSTSTASTVPSTHNSLPPSSSSDFLNLGKCASGVMFLNSFCYSVNLSFSLVKVD